MNATNHTHLCTIAGSDPTGGAGLQGDLKTFAAHQVVGTAVVTALTVQGRGGVARVEPVAADLVAQQVEVVGDEVRPAGWKTGMLANEDIIRAVARQLERRAEAPLVVDPVLGATAGGALLEADALAPLVSQLVPLADVLTPNLPEAARLLGVETVPEASMTEAARALLELGPRAVLLKGGHGEGDEAVDVLVTHRQAHVLTLPRLAGAFAHGTGCALAASLASRLALGASLLDAATGAKAYVYRALAAAGQSGVLHHAVAP